MMYLLGEITDSSNANRFCYSKFHLFQAAQKPSDDWSERSQTNFRRKNDKAFVARGRGFANLLFT